MEQQHSTLLIELGTEELPPKALKSLSQSFAQNIQEELEKAEYSYVSVTALAAPRRLAVQVQECAESQADKKVEKRGPAVSAAFDADGNPTKAAQGWARSNGIEASKAERLVTDKGEWLLHIADVKGTTLKDTLQSIVNNALKRLPIAKPMRWGDAKAEFIRPVHSICALHGDAVIPIELFGLKADRLVSGHRFHSKGMLSVDHADSYVKVLQQAHVMVDYQARMDLIEQQLIDQAARLNLSADFDKVLLEEISSLVEWPVVLSASFDPAFLSVPKEALIYTMKDDQKYVPLINSDGSLSSTFLFVSNIESKDPSQVISGNEKVIRPRLADADFFFNTDKKTSLEEKAKQLGQVLFQKDLGTVADKVARLQQICKLICSAMNLDSKHAVRAAQLSKADLVSNMVMEFPSVQGIMGKYYAQHDGEAEEVAQAIEEQYLPRFAGDKLPSTQTGAILALAEKLDTLVGIFGIGKVPKGDKDPFALRRSAIGMLRILIANNASFSLPALVEAVVDIYANKLSNSNCAQQVTAFLYDRFKPLYQDTGIGADVVSAVLAQTPDSVSDLHARVLAVNDFKSLEESATLSAANKRVANILAKNALSASKLADVDHTFFEDPAETALYEALSNISSSHDALIAKLDYTEILQSLSQLAAPLDSFFDKVMIMAPDEAVKRNRIALVGSVRSLFLSVADISLLSH